MIGSNKLVDGLLTPRRVVRPTQALANIPTTQLDIFAGETKQWY